VFGDALCHLGIELGELVQQRSAPMLKLVSLGAPRSPCLGFGDLARLQPGHQHLRAVTSEGYVFDCLPAAFGSGDITGRGLFRVVASLRLNDRVRPRLQDGPEGIMSGSRSRTRPARR